jgi:hypothetical protein
MAAFTLESLVLRGVAVLRDGTVSLRRGAGVVAYRKTPEVRPSMRPLSPSWFESLQPKQRPDHAVQNCADRTAIGTGRSRRG